MKKFEAAYAAWIVRNPWIVIAIQHFARRGARDRFVEALFRFKLSGFFQ